MPDLHSGLSDARVYLRNQLWRIDLQLLKSYSLGRAGRMAIGNRPQDSHTPIDFTYGETHWGSMRRILQLTEARAGSRLMELGSGTGRLALFASKCIGLHAHGVEMITPFVTRANEIANDMSLDRCHFEQGNIFDHSWAEASILYIVATTFGEETLRELGKKCLELSPGARIVVTSHSPACPNLALETMEVLDFSWGPTAVFVLRRN
ncbi:MAG: precorrin-6B methylase 2 [Rhodothermales bacterium]|jgi:precorrin-6B methylase 2